MEHLYHVMLFLWLSYLFVFPTHAQTKQGTVEHIKVHGASLEGNLSGDSPDRDVSVYLPPTYSTEANRHYPVIYMLHGFTDSDSKWFGLEDHWINLPQILDQALAEDKSSEVIVVMPNAYTRFKGSMYSTSVTVGDWETFIAEELVAYIDSHYRTLPQASSRGLAGHSMGGYGTIRIGMQYPDVFSSIYLLSPCCMSPRTGGNTDALRQAEAVRTVEEIDTQSFFCISYFGYSCCLGTQSGQPPVLHGPAHP